MAPRLDYYAVSPRFAGDLLKQYTALKHADVDPTLRELVLLRASIINGCHFCIGLHRQEALEKGETPERLDALNNWNDSALFTEQEQAALAWTDAVTLVSQTHVPDDVYTRVKGFFTDTQIVDLTVLIANINALNRMAIAFRAEG